MANVLLVEDNIDCQKSLAHLLRHQGHAVECAWNGQDALEVLERFHPDTIILDLMMPIMDGLTFLAALRRDSRWREIRVIIHSGYGDSLPAPQLVALGVSEVVVKGSSDFNRLFKLVA